MRSICGTRWTADALRARLRATSTLEETVSASSRLFAERRLELLKIAGKVETGAISPAAAVVAYEAIIAVLASLREPELSA